MQGRGCTGPIGLAEAAAQVQPLRKHGRPKKCDERKGVIHTLIRGTGNAAYLKARLQRDAPDVAQALDRGEFRLAQAMLPIVLANNSQPQDVRMVSVNNRTPQIDCGAEGLGDFWVLGIKHHADVFEPRSLARERLENHLSVYRDRSLALNRREARWKQALSRSATGCKWPLPFTRDLSHA